MYLELEFCAFFQGNGTNSRDIGLWVSPEFGYRCVENVHYHRINQVGTGGCMSLQLSEVDFVERGLV